MQGFPAHPGMTLLGIGGVLARARSAGAGGLGFLVKIHDRPLQECGQADAACGVHSQRIPDGELTLEDDLVGAMKKRLVVPRSGTVGGGWGAGGEGRGGDEKEVQICDEGRETRRH